MKKIIHLSFVFISLKFFALAVFGQIGSGIGSFSAAPNNKTLPYSAESLSERVMPLVDGNKITQVFKRFEYRDGEGRTRNEQTRSSNPEFPPEPSSETITISDPVAGFIYFLNPSTKTAYRAPVNPPNRASASINLPMPRPGYSIQRENLGNRIIEDLEAVGNRSITTVAPGALGNEKELKITYETWTSTKLKLTLLMISNDPRYGISTTRVTKIRLDEPDKSLFEIPADYKIIDQSTQ